MAFPFEDVSGVEEAQGAGEPDSVGRIGGFECDEDSPQVEPHLAHADLQPVGDLGGLFTSGVSEEDG